MKRGKSDVRFASVHPSITKASRTQEIENKRRSEGEIGRWERSSSVIARLDGPGSGGSHFASAYEVNERAATGGRFADVVLPLNRAPAVNTLGNRRSNGKAHATAAGLIAQ